MVKKNENKINRRWTNLGLLVVSLMLAATLVACQKPVEENPTPSNSEVVSEVASEAIAEEVSEPVSEEVSETASEPVSEEPEIVDGVQMVYCENYKELCTYFEDLEEPVIAVFSFDVNAKKEQALLFDGAHYTIETDFTMSVKTPGVISDMYSTVSYIRISDYDYNDIHEWDIGVMTTGTDIEVPLIITYEDGTKETITVYITKDWKYSWED